MRVALVLLSACGVHHDVDVAGFDVLVSSTRIYVFPLFDEREENWPRLPDVGACSEIESDAVITFPGKLTAVELDGDVLSGGLHEGMNTWLPWEGRGITDAAVLRATDDDLSIEVPLHAGPFLAATDVAIDGSMSVTWDASGADSVFVGTDSTFALTGCRFDGATETYAARSGASSVEVQPLATAEVTDTDLGPVRVFYGEATWIDVPPSQ